MSSKPSISTIDQLKNALQELAAMNLSPEAQAVLERANSAAEGMAADLQSSNQERAKFISTVTHELRLPLTSIKGYTDLLRQGIVGPVNDQQKNFLNVVRSNVDRMSSLIADLADMSYLQTGRLKLQPRRTTLQAIFEEATTPHLAKFEEKGQTLSVQIEDHIHEIRTDHNRLVQILGVLLLNANRYTPQGGTIRLSAHKDDKLICIEVQDTGIGISEEDQEKLFSAFFRSENQAVREFPGWGLGLHVAHMLAELMGGQLGAESGFGKGSTFWLKLPYDSTDPL